MKNFFKKIIKNFLKVIWLYPLFRKYKILLYKEQFKNPYDYSLTKKFLLSLKILSKVRVVAAFRRRTLIEKKAILFRKSCRKMKFPISPNDKFVYDMDPFILPMYFDLKERCIIGNLTINYTKLLKEGLAKVQKEVIKELEQKEISQPQRNFLYSLLEVYKGIKLLRGRYLKKLTRLEWRDNQNIKEIQKMLTRVPLYSARSFRQALQSFLFINFLIWLDDHYLVGLGRVDQILYPYLKTDLEKGVLIKKEAFNLLKEFLMKLHQGYKYKSNVLLGDTGQAIILGGKNMDGSDASNELTFMIMDALKELRVPDPKIILRVHSKTSDELWNKAFECLLSGLQYPLFSNDEVIIPALIKFGYLKEDAFNYGTSACWEPLIPGKSLDQNNLLSFNFLEPLRETMERINKENLNIKSFDDFLILYKENLRICIRKEIRKLNEIDFEPSPLLSLLMDDCLENLKDISEGGTKYNNYGILSVGLGNAVNALFNIERIVFRERKYSLDELSRILKKNFSHSEVLLENLRNKGAKFCMDDERVISLVNDLVEVIFQTLKNFDNKFGGKFKFGLSSPAFFSLGKDSPASLDGRKYGESFGVNISPLPFSPSLSYTEIANFTSKINYERAFNGAVLDLMVEKGFMEKNREKFINLFKTLFKTGGMQFYLNILDYHTLITAKKNPELFPNLIVRVWGFCAYFKDLPEEYQNLVIERAQYYDSISSKYSEI